MPGAGRCVMPVTIHFLEEIRSSWDAVPIPVEKTEGNGMGTLHASLLIR